MSAARHETRYDSRKLGESLKMTRKQKIQLCVRCEEPTGRCEEDSIYLNDEGPLCEECYVVLSEFLENNDE